MAGRQPRYDIPRAAPEGPLRDVQRFVNTVDLSHDREWLTEWLAENGLASPTEADRARARAVREAIRDLLSANGRRVEPAEAAQILSTAANAAMLTIDFGRPALVPRAPGIDGILGRVAVACFDAIGDGSWNRLKCCRSCRWAFYDGSKNRSATWCSMQLCGNRSKTRTYRRARRPPAAGR